MDTKKMTKAEWCADYDMEMAERAASAAERAKTLGDTGMQRFFERQEAEYFKRGKRIMASVSKREDA